MNVNISCIKDALDQLDITYEIISNNENTVRLKDNGLCFINSTTPFNSEGVSRFLLDKAFVHDVIDKKVRMPRVKSYFDPHRTDWDQYKKFKSIENVAKDIEVEFGYPVIVKRNKGSRAQHVFISNSISETLHALSLIFKNDRAYDYVALAEEYIVPDNEFCLMIVNNSPVFAYEKKVIEPIKEGDTSILRSKHTKAVITKDSKLYELFEFIKPVLHSINSLWFSADIIEGKDGRLYLIELNSSPGFGYFVRDNGRDLLVRVYKNMIKEFLSK